MSTDPNSGAQYYWVDRIFYWNSKPRTEANTPAENEGNILFQWVHSQPMGTLDTSLVSTDYMNNPRTMNAVYETRARLLQSLQTGIERIEGGERDNTQFQDFSLTENLASAFDPSTGDVASMRVLKDGSDSVGALGALNRVYLNIGLFSEEWILHFRGLLGGQMISPIKIADAQKNSVYWQATEANSPDMAVFFLVTTRADKLAETEAGPELLAGDEAQVDRGMEVFAENCAACHSDRAHQPDPEPAYGVDQGLCAGGGSGPHYLECWGRYWDWAQSESFKSQMVELVKQPDFLTGNYLSTERRVPMDLLGVNACSPTATNAVKGDIWDNFSSSTYKSLPAVGPVTIEHPESGGASSWQALGNGRGYLRPASLVSVWASAPYLLKNSVGYERHYYGPDFYGDVKPGVTAEGYGTGSTNAFDAPAAVSCPAADPNNPYMPCTENRVRAFESSIRKMLSPETRAKDTVTTEPVPGYMYRISAPACIQIPKGYTPDIVQNWAGTLNWLAPWAITENGDVAVGPLPRDFPLNALLNTQLLPDNDSDTSLIQHGLKMAKGGRTLLGAFKELGGQCSPTELADPAVRVHAAEVMKDSGMIDTLVGLSKCPDYVVNKGHGFGSDLSASDKDALIAYLKRF